MHGFGSVFAARQPFQAGKVGQEIIIQIAVHDAVHCLIEDFRRLLHRLSACRFEGLGQDTVDVILHVVVKVSLVEGVEQAHGTALVVVVLHGLGRLLIDTPEMLLNVLQRGAPLGGDQRISVVKVFGQFLARSGKQLLQKGFPPGQYFYNGPLGIHVVHGLLQFVE